MTLQINLFSSVSLDTSFTWGVAANFYVIEITTLSVKK